ncbi:GNAT family N-acetyltransferase [Calothrix sp. 336/3]|uniref:GNAT family N-acetyltransferase n=1 Tax=Calothrix sp. 336/3 TaxID=1337936 RepID=UPI0004E35C69|nr:GNAT family N-acetyltransferase [Calothrix sp. 336/3]AKG20853.1 acetyltransferase [Calothrix sp. 336/3]
MNSFLAQADHIEDLSRLFDRYRVFYNQESDVVSCQQFLHERLQNRDSVIFVAEDNQVLTGFTQLYPSFSSVSMKRVWILNDLFVAEDYRRQGVATLLMDTAEQYAVESGAIRIVLATQVSNLSAQKLYESRRYIQDKDFYHYALRLG